VGERFEGVVVDVDGDGQDRGEVVVRDPAVEAKVTTEPDSALPLGEEVTVTLAEADPATRTVRFTW